MYSDSNVAHLYVCLCLTVDTALHLFALYLIGDVFFAAEELSKYHFFGVILSCQFSLLPE
jgi:hypothetical protein